MSTPRFPEPVGPVPPDTGTLDAVVTAARRRRARRAQAGGAALGVALLLAGVVVANDGGGRQTIGVAEGGADAPLTRSDDDSEVPAPSPRATGCIETDYVQGAEEEVVTCTDPAPGSWAPYPGASGAPEPSATTRAGESTPPKPSATPSAEPTSGPSASPRPAPRTVPPRETPAPRPSETPPPRPSSSPTADPAPSEPSQAARGEMRRSHQPGEIHCPDNAEWCADASATGGRPVEFSVRACRDNDAGPGRLESGPPGADFAVTRDGQQVWRWSSGQAFPAVMQYLDVEPGDCYVWSTTWQGVDDYNRRLPAGQYGLLAYVSAPEQFPQPVRIGFRLS